MTYDQLVVLWFYSLASPVLDDVASFVTAFGNVWAVAAMATVLFAYLWWRGYHRLGVLVFAGVYGAIIISGLLKELFQRSRPELWDRFTIEHSYSLPSTHAMGTMAFVACVLVIAWPTKWRWYALSAGLTYLLVIGASRVYLGVHYPTDILAGWLFGALWVGVVYYAVKKLFASNQR